jgi:hypothetical protein
LRLTGAFWIFLQFLFNRKGITAAGTHLLTKFTAWTEQYASLHIVNRRWKALILGGAFVLLAVLLGRSNLGTPVPFLLLSPGIAAGTLAPDAHFDPDGNYGNQWGPVSQCVVYIVNIAIYTGIAYLVLTLIQRLRHGNLN